MINLGKRLLGMVVYSAIMFIFSIFVFAITYASPSYQPVYEWAYANHGILGTLWVVLLVLTCPVVLIPWGMTLPNPFPGAEDFFINNVFGNVELFILILIAWIVGALLAGIVSRGGLSAGAQVGSLVPLIYVGLFGFVSFKVFLVNFEFLTFLNSFWGIVVTILFAYAIGGLAILSLVTSLFGGIGGIIGKVLPDFSLVSDEE